MAEQRVQRRLAAILAADVVGYSRLVEADEEGTRARLRSLHAELITPRIAADGGRIVKTMGDGILVEFPSAVAAVRNALAIQSTMAGRDHNLPEDRRIRFRVGINVGDVIVEGDDIHGDGVNVAARLEGLCDPGGVFVSGTVYDQVSEKLTASFEDLGEQTLKNIARPIRVFRVRVDTGQTVVPDETETIRPPTDKPSIAVLPFQNMSGDPEQEYFADGMAEDIITALSHFRWFFVIARNSSFTYKGKAVDVRQVGRELGVRYVLEGSVRKAGNRLRITAQLVDAMTGNHIWADRFDGELAEVFDLQDRITEGVAGAIEPSLRKAEIERAQRKRPDNLDAYDNYLRALPHVWANTTSDYDEALTHLDRALTTDPSFATAHGLAALCRFMRFTRSLDATDRDAAIDHARTVLVRDNDDSNALAFAGLTLAAMARDYTAALGAVDKAVALNPNSSRAHTNRAGVLNCLGRYDEALIAATTANRLSPLDPMRYGPELVISVAHFANGRYAEAIEAAKHAIQSSPSFSGGHVLLTASYVRAGMTTEAKEALQRLREALPHGGLESARAGLGAIPCSELIIDALREAGLPE